MLKLVNITKDYVLKGVDTVHALKGISLNFRRNEFVAVLGPSGCGKTTTLNIIGGLDRYTSGDLIIEGKSTKNFNDHDWDTYRNHSIGFVFQSYNLIYHQTILKNVELALTISGIKKQERKQRALEALKKVGLEGMEKKKPNQLSGGQMQRVAIARALINNPEILLADEPTGALDSETSIQIMDLLKEVAKDRLVVMVTHNPDLAEKYATRIVNMLDGVILSDSNPYEGESEQEREHAHQNDVYSKGNKKKSSMSFITATGLSFSNLLSKIHRTILISIAGSIGIIGVSTVLAVSNGVNHFVASMQDDMLSAYPVSIAEQGVDYSTLMSGLSTWDKSQLAKFDITNEVGLDSMINYLMDKYKDFTSVKTNEINDELIDYIYNAPEETISSISLDYGIDMTNNIFTKWKRNSKDNEAANYISLNGLTQMYISELKTVDGFSEYAMFVDLFTAFMKQLPGDEKYLLDQYDLIGQNSRFASKEDEIMLVVDSDQTLTDLLLAQMGYYTEDQFLNITKKAIEMNKEDPDEEYLATLTYPESYTFDELLGKELVYYPHNSIWNYKTIERQYVKWTFSLAIPGSSEMKISMNVYYHEASGELEGTMVIDGMASLDVSMPSLDASRPDPNKPYLGNWEFKMNYNGVPIVIDFEIKDDGTVSSAGLGSTTYEVEDKDLSGYMYSAYIDEAWVNPMNVKVVGILKPKDTIRFGSLSRGVYYTPALTRKMIKDSLESEIITNETYGIESHIKKYIYTADEDMSSYKAYVTYPYTSFRDPDNPKLIDDGVAMALNTDFSNSLSSMFSITRSTTLETDKAYLRSLAGLAAKQITSGAGIVTGYHFDDLPYEISIYPKNFEKKQILTKYLDKWNEEGNITVFKGTEKEKVLTLEERDELTYTDTIEMIINVINTLITAITIALIVFTSLSLVVSCFMIAVITYISTMERVKEIGVIRSLGGRKLDISRLFIAECLIIGLASGLIGVITTYFLSMIINLIVAPFGVSNIALLAIPTALIMIALSVVLNVISGFIPSMKASRQDPVIALRSE